MRSAILCCALASALSAGGCRLFHGNGEPLGHLPLQPATPSPDSVTLEIIWARFPHNDPQLNDAVWHEIDETQVAPAVRRELVNNGFRVGIAGGTLPDALAERLHLKSGAPADSSQDAPAADQESELLVEPTVRRRLLQLRRGRRAEIQASDVYQALPLLVHQGRELGGKTYHDAQAVYALRVDPQPDQTVKVELTPELHHGAPRLRWTSEDGALLRQAPLRDCEVFAPLRINATLAPGEMLILTSLPDAGSRLGHYFHTVDSPQGREQKVVLVRLAQVPPSSTFDDPGP